MVSIDNLWIKVDDNDKAYLPLCSYLSILERAHDIKGKGGRVIHVDDQYHDLFTRRREEHLIYIPVGYLEFIRDIISESEIVDNRTKSNIYYVDNLIENIFEYKNILTDKFDLRPNQLLAIRKILYSKRCIVQMSTGAGKSEVMCALVKILSINNDNTIPTTLVIEPTSRLVQDMYDRFNKYDIPVTIYNHNRRIIPNHVNICHPKSLGNDIEKDPNLLSDVVVFLGDECHHMASPSFRQPTYFMPNLVYCSGVSASTISEKHVGLKDIRQYSLNEALAIGATGPLVMNDTANRLIDSGYLSKPILVLLNNAADEPLHTSNVTDWHAVSKYRLESPKRIALVAKSAAFFHNEDRKSLILVRTRRWAYLILKELDRLGLSDVSRASFGGGVFERYNGHDFEADQSGVYDRYARGEFTILIGTSHIYEGADIQNLDTLILAYGGASERLQIQGVGRVLRLTKTGKYAWIIDFNDYGDPVLSSQLRKRMYRYRNIIGIPENHIINEASLKDMANAFYEFEDIHRDVYDDLERYIK